MKNKPNKNFKYNYWNIELKYPGLKVGKDLVLTRSTHNMDSSKDEYVTVAVNFPKKIDNKVLLLTIKEMLNAIERNKQT